MKKQSFFTAMLAVAVGIILLLNGAELGEGIRRGLSVCFYSVIPSLFPFMALSVFICKSPSSIFFEGFFRPVTKLLKIPVSCGGVLLAAIIGGYPSAAKCLNDFVLEQRIDQKTASKMLCYCVNAGPPFLITAVGIGVFHNIKTGFIIFISQIISSVLIAFFISLFSKERPCSFSQNHKKDCNIASSVVESVVSGAEGCFRMCAFIILSFGATEIFLNFVSSSNPIIKAVLSGIIEVTSGVFACKDINGIFSAVLTGAICSFSGISVILQVAAAVDESKIPISSFLISRFFHASITGALVFLFMSISSDSVSTAVFGKRIYNAALSASAPASVSLLCMAALFLLSLVPPKSEKEPLFAWLLQKFTH